MYPSFTSTTLYNNYINNTNLFKPYLEDYCPSSSSPFQLPSPYYISLEDGMIFNELLQQDHINHNANNIAVPQQFTTPDIRASLQSAMGKGSNNNGVDGFNKPKGNNKRKRASTKDKINTAQGPRDRRMRLSIEVSKKFFKLQDMLGFDKASKTVEWLLMKSKSNIQELMITHGKSSFLGVSISESSTSKCELLSEYVDGDQNEKSLSSSKQKGKKKTRRLRKSSYLLRPLAKETREIARKRARERTLEKSSKLACDNQFSKFIPCLDLTMDQGVNCFGSWIINQPEQPLQNKGVSPITTISSWNPSFLFNYQHPQEHQLSDFQILGNLWDGKN